MIFNTFWFLAFVLCFYPMYWGIRTSGFRKYWLLAGCIFFHFHFAGPAGVLPIALLGAIVYWAGLSRRRWALYSAIGLSVAALIFYKYTTFFFHSLGQWAGLPEIAGAGGASRIPPLAISFFTFEFIHYLVDVLKGRPSIRKPQDFALFTVFFPSLVAGPIKRYEEFIPEMEKGLRELRQRDVSTGLMQVAFGFLKKCIADSLNVFIATFEERVLTETPGLRWAFIAALALRILFDFSGYSDMAIGFSRMMGIRLPANFNWPYFATNLQEFWHRWHISLSTWIRDYIYIALGGNRHGLFRKTLIVIFAFALCGLWHGPAWNFVLWGLYHGLGLAVCSLYAEVPKVGPALKWLFHRVPFLGWLLTLPFVAFGWLLFFYPAEKALRYALALFYAN